MELSYDENVRNHDVPGFSGTCIIWQVIQGLFSRKTGSFRA